MSARQPESVAISHFLLLHEILYYIQEYLENESKKNNGSQHESEENKLGKAVRSRLREAPSLLLSSGPAGLLTFYLSKIDKTILDTLVDVFNEATSINYTRDAINIVDCKIKPLLEHNENKFKNIIKEFTSPGGGYTTVIAMIASYANSQGLIDLNSPPQPPAESQNQEQDSKQESDNLSHRIISKMAELAKKTLDNPNYSMITTALLLPYLTTAKKLAEAAIKADGEEQQ